MKIFYKLLLVLIVPFTLVFFSFPSGSPGGKTGSPGDGGATCHDCHTSFDVITASNWITSNIPPEGYTLGTTYMITATGSHEGVVNFGFELTAEDNTGNKVGMLTLTDETRTQLTNNDQAVTHTANGIEPSGDFNTWSFNWTAPETEGGDITFYAAFNAGNGADGNSGDQIYTSTMSVSQSAVGIGNDLLAAKVQVYPNPAANFVNLDIPEGSDIRLIDMLGHKVLDIKNTSASERVNISQLQQGVYFVQVLNGGGSATVRLLRN